jgi:hypothetical protein
MLPEVIGLTQQYPFAATIRYTAFPNLVLCVVLVIFISEPVHICTERPGPNGSERWHYMGSDHYTRTSVCEGRPHRICPSGYYTVRYSTEAGAS